MKILVVSDTHGKNQSLWDVIEEENPDRIFHLGDGQSLEEEIWMYTEAECDIVCGNCDWGNDLPSELTIPIGKHKILLTHGHYYGVNFGYEEIAQAAHELGCDIALYGHTHMPTIDYYEDLIIANPGSLSYPRQSSREHTYMIMDVDSDGNIKMSLRSLEEKARDYGN
ncbi:MAG: metallophosphoesterase [Pseudobutyrivibrio sp.]|nr:metallophosphoesterase [Pseudobutyrivibrio sp.]